MRKVLVWMRARPLATLGLVLLAVLVLLNLLAYRHAHAMTHYVPNGKPWKGRAESMSLMGKAKALCCGIDLGRPSQPGKPSDFGLVHEVHSFAGEVGDLEAWFVPHCNARGVVLLFHGYTRSKASVLPEARAFHELGYACFLVDFRGCGGSAGDVTTIGYREAGDVVRAVAYVRRNWPGQPLILFGQSMGSAASLRALADLGVQADAAIFECPFDQLLSTIQARFRVIGAPAFPSAQLLVFWGGAQHGFNAFRHNPVDYASRVTCPVLLLHGQGDSRVSCPQIESIHSNLRGEKHLHVFAGLGHESYVAKRPDEWKGQVTAFLARR
jgi:uncharacterized protein